MRSGIILVLLLLFFVIDSIGQRPGVNAILVHTRFSKVENYQLVTKILEQENPGSLLRRHPLNDSTLKTDEFVFSDYNPVDDEDNDNSFFITFHVKDSLVTIRAVARVPSVLVSILTEGKHTWHVEKRVYFDARRKSEMGRAFRRSIDFARLIPGKIQYITEDVRKPRKKKKK